MFFEFIESGPHEMPAYALAMFLGHEDRIFDADQLAIVHVIGEIAVGITNRPSIETRYEVEEIASVRSLLIFIETGFVWWDINPTLRFPVSHRSIVFAVERFEFVVTLGEYLAGNRVAVQIPPQPV